MKRRDSLQRPFQSFSNTAFSEQPIPESEGGEGGDNLAYVIALEEISKVCATTGVVYSVQAGLGMGLFAKYGIPGTERKITEGCF